MYKEVGARPIAITSGNHERAVWAGFPFCNTKNTARGREKSRRGEGRVFHDGMGAGDRA